MSRRRKKKKRHSIKRIELQCRIKNTGNEYVVQIRDQFGRRWPEAFYHTDDSTDAQTLKNLTPFPSSSK
ncbi:hypothetical protein N9B39_03050 [bacterium]|nr:hypothetical protein [bacterium]